MRTFKQIGEVLPDIGHYLTFPRFKKPFRPLQEGEVVKIVYTDGREDIIVVTAESSCGRCMGCFYRRPGLRCPVWSNDNKETRCLIGSGHVAVDIDSIMEDL